MQHRVSASSLILRCTHAFGNVDHAVLRGGGGGGGGGDGPDCVRRQGNGGEGWRTRTTVYPVGLPYTGKRGCRFQTPGQSRAVKGIGCTMYDTL